jgi:hypothetical protein
LIFDALGWLLISAAFGVGLYSLVAMLAAYACDLRDARGEPPEAWDYTSTEDAAHGPEEGK